MASRFAERWIARPRPLPIADGLFGKPRLRVVMGQQLGAGRNGIRKSLDQRLGNLLMVLLPGALQERLIGDLLRDGVPEGIDMLGEEMHFVEELGGLQVG
jgi:hypothetical protein